MEFICLEQHRAIMNIFEAVSSHRISITKHPASLHRDSPWRSLEILLLRKAYRKKAEPNRPRYAGHKYDYDLDIRCYIEDLQGMLKVSHQEIQA